MDLGRLNESICVVCRAVLDWYAVSRNFFPPFSFHCRVFANVMRFVHAAIGLYEQIFWIDLMSFLLHYKLSCTFTTRGLVTFKWIYLVISLVMFLLMFFYLEFCFARCELFFFFPRFLCLFQFDARLIGRAGGIVLVPCYYTVLQRLVGLYIDIVLPFYFLNFLSWISASFLLFRGECRRNIFLR